MTSLYTEKIFGSGSKNSKTFEGLHFSPMVWYDGMDERYWNQRCYEEGLGEAQVLLSRFIEELELFDIDSSETREYVKKESVRSSRRKIFVVHGHDEKLKMEVARFLEKLDIEPIILHEQADRGQTIIEKFEKHSEVAFAIVLLTPDDIGGQDNSSLRKRARQNVIFEFGYFIGKLGRSNVCGLYCDGVELPSDYTGVLYTKAEGGWQLNIIRELKAAGFSVDANRIT